MRTRRVRVSRVPLLTGDFRSGAIGCFRISGQLAHFTAGIYPSPLGIPSEDVFHSGMNIENRDRISLKSTCAHADSFVSILGVLGLGISGRLVGRILN